MCAFSKLKYFVGETSNIQIGRKINGNSWQTKSICILLNVPCPLVRYIRLLVHSTHMLRAETTRLHLPLCVRNSFPHCVRSPIVCYFVYHVVILVRHWHRDSQMCVDVVRSPISSRCILATLSAFVRFCSSTPFHKAFAKYEKCAPFACQTLHSTLTTHVHVEYCNGACAALSLKCYLLVCRMFELHKHRNANSYSHIVW